MVTSPFFVSTTCFTAVHDYFQVDEAQWYSPALDYLEPLKEQCHKILFFWS